MDLLYWFYDSTYIPLTILVIISILVIHFLGITEASCKPNLYFQDGSWFIEEILKRTPSLTNRYIPVSGWGKNGHLQTILYVIFGRFGKLSKSPTERRRLIASDSSVVTYDIFRPDESVCKRENQDVILVVPGICNHAETTYVRAFSYYMTRLGFSVAVFNHTGALKNEEITAPRFFTYGHTDDLQLVVDHLLATEKVEKLIGIGFSLGGNILLKYLGEEPSRQDRFHLCASVCQGYDVVKIASHFSEWTSFRRGYNYGMSQNYKRVIMRHKDTLLKRSQSEPAFTLDWHEVSSATSLNALDHEIVTKMFDFDDLEQFYKWSSSKVYMHRIYIPTLALNALDDPLIPESLYEAPKMLIRENPDAMFVVMKHGGHLGFFEGGYLIPNHLSWLDRMLGEYIIASMDALRLQKLRNGNESDLIDGAAIRMRTRTT